MKPAHERTFRQYVDARNRAVAAEYGVTIAEASTCYSEHDDRQHYFRAILSAWSEGVVIRRQVLDNLTAGEWYRLCHDYPDAARAAVARGYLRPGVRALNRAHSAAMRGTA